MQHISIEGVRLEVRHIPGSTQDAPLVFLHEGLGSVDLWQTRDTDWPKAVCQATGRSGWVYSRRGYGRSDPIPDVRGRHQRNGLWGCGRHPADYMHIEAWEVLPRVLQSLGISRPVLVGHSDGATIALLHASRCEVQACVVMAPHLFVEPVAIEAIADARKAYEDNAADERSLRSRLSRYHDDVDCAFWQWNDVWLSEVFRSFDIRETCRAISVPVLGLQGTEDEYGTMDQLTALNMAVPGARLVTLSQCRHSPHKDQPEATVNEIVRFLGRG
ncbi:alpha/beta hydrolase [Hydrogenophaga sp. 5NK40-0174]|uniref:alpha/beta fold hydrolase n=1 Tax=Hydrogenophaga sp. 5NK40-0174 TaxID=3127649 RepID=UPI003109810D